MNKQELIEKLANLDRVYGEKFYVALDDVSDLVKQLDEQQKPVVPQFVADWIEESKKHCKNVVEFFKYKYPNVEMIKWIESEKRFDLIARAWLDGYEVEKEKRYLVKIKNIDTNSAYLKHQLQNNHWYWGSLTECGAFSPYHTKKELEAAGFVWVFDCEGVEIEELEDE